MANEEDGMDTEKSTVRLLGAAFLIVFVASVLSDVLLSSATGSGTMSDILASIAGNLALVRISNLVALAIQSTGIVVLAALLYVVLSRQNQIVALVALGWWLVEAVALAVSKIGAYALIPLSLEFVEARAPEAAHFQTLGNLLYYGVDRQGYAIHSLFFCLGGVLWYYLFYKSRYVPRALSVWGLATVSLVLVKTLLALYDPDLARVIPDVIVGAPYILFEALIGPWLMIKGIRGGSERARLQSVMGGNS
jgi:hypothetical protein